MQPLFAFIIAVVAALVATPMAIAASRRLGFLDDPGPRKIHAAPMPLLGGAAVFVGAALWGLHMGLTQGLLAALVAASAPADLRGRYMSVYWIGWGLARTLAPLIGGFLNDNIAPQAIWIGGLLIGLTSAFGLVTLNSITKARAALRT